MNICQVKQPTSLLMFYFFFCFCIFNLENAEMILESLCFKFFLGLNHSYVAANQWLMKKIWVGLSWINNAINFE